MSKTYQFKISSKSVRIRTSPTSLDNRSASSDEGSINLIGHSSISQYRRESSRAFSSELPQNHVRTVSDSSAFSNANFQETQGDENSASQLSTSPGYSRDTSGELNPGLDTPMPSMHREPEFPPRLMDTRGPNLRLPKSLASRPVHNG
ncbi:unnamed protein product [Vicia faba]|uniref:Uncharacterized protein n=1 Tax=Vicia faba TaxID=3906 RepID=A0AAV1AX03_VICFA|nr:unnamed protein product [Vicia faba]